MKIVRLFNRNRNVRRIIILLLSALLGFVSSLNLPAWSNYQKFSLSSETIIFNQQQALELAQQGELYYNLGKLSEAFKLWQQAAQAFEKAGDRNGKEKSLINQAQALQDLGLYIQAGDTLLQAFGTDSKKSREEQISQLLKILSQESQPLSSTKIIGLRSLGDILRKQGNLAESKQFLEISLDKTRGTNLEPLVLLSLGNTERALGNQISSRWDYGEITEIIETGSLTGVLEPYQEAFKAYQQAAALESTATITAIQAKINQLSLGNQIENWWIEETNKRIVALSKLDQSKSIATEKQFLSQLEAKLARRRKTLENQITPQLQSLPPSRTSIYTLINFAECLLQVAENNQAKPIVNLAWQQSQKLKDRPAESYALGYLGKIAQQEGKLSEAIKFTEQALLLAQAQSVTNDVREITYLWQAQLGKLKKEQGNLKEAIAAYAAAYNNLQSLRSDLTINISEVQFDFRQEVKPVYLELADLLLQSNLSETELSALIAVSPDKNQTVLSETPPQSAPRSVSLRDRLQLARRVIESLQLAELDNLFQDPCAQEAIVPVEIDDLDPQAAVIYPIILSDRLELILSLPGKSLSQVTVAVSEQQINTTIEELYNNLDNDSVDYSASNIFATSNPTSEELQQNLETLLPLLGKLYNWLIQPLESQLSSQTIKTLVFVINGSLQQVPLTALYDGQKYLIEKYGVALVPSLQLVRQKQINKKKPNIIAAGIDNSITRKGTIFPALPNVSQELAQIQQIFPKTKILVDQQFTVTNLQKQLQRNSNIVHLATHGLFSSQPDQSFILTGDGNSLNLEQLNNLFNQQANPPELLVLSACETATGDEQAVLGLAGVAVRSGVSSIVATLWSVGDESTAQLMSNFYQQLRNSKETKLSALRTAQLSLIDSLRKNPPWAELKQFPPHPYYWSSYVLVGDWL
jgi:CHAT domain-containing protein